MQQMPMSTRPAKRCGCECMLDAFLRKRAQLPPELRAGGAQLIVEDAITSTLFTPISFMGASDVHQVISLLLGRSDIPVPETCKVTLWPTFEAVAGYKNLQSVEPDV